MKSPVNVGRARKVVSGSFVRRRKNLIPSAARRLGLGDGPKKKSPSDDASAVSYVSLVPRDKKEKKILSRISSKISKVVGKKSKDHPGSGSKTPVYRRKPLGSKEPPKQPPTVSRSVTAESSSHSSSSDVSPAPGNGARSQEDFSLQRALAPSCSPRVADGGGSTFDASKSLPAPVEEGEGLDDSEHSIPSLGPEAPSPAETTSAATSKIPQDGTHKGEAATKVPRDAAREGEATDSALMWGCLSAVLGAPAPEVVRAPRRRAPVNLWLDAGDADLDDVVLPDDDLRDGEDSSDECSIPSLGALDLSDECSIPSLGPQEEKFDDDAIPDMDDDLQFASSAPPAKSSGKEIADTTLAWSALAAILGSPAPSATRKSVAKVRVDLWGVDAGPDPLPEIDADSLCRGESKKEEAAESTLGLACARVVIEEKRKGIQGSGEESREWRWRNGVW